MAKKRRKRTDVKRYATKEKKLKDLNHHINMNRTSGQKAADIVTKVAGSWTFIITFCLIMFVWMMANLSAYVYRWDPYPFILLNFVLSALAALQAPIILMSQNRETDRDRTRSERDFLINRKAEREIEDIQKDLKTIKELLRRK